MDFTKLIAAGLNLDIDYDRMSKELLEVQANTHSKAVSSANTKEVVQSLFLRKHPKFTNYSFRGAKELDVNGWSWDTDINVPYTHSIIDALPFVNIGAVRVMYFHNVSGPPHTDWNDCNDLEHTLGLSIIPSTGNTWCNVWSEKQQKYLPITGNAMLLNDSITHEIPHSTGTRITMRIFGKIDYSWFIDKINYNCCYFN